MALTRNEKAKLIELYKKNLEWAKNLVVLKQSWIPVNEINNVRKELSEVWGKLLTVKKRLFLKVVAESDLTDIDLSVMDKSVSVLIAYEDEYAPLKAVNKMKVAWKKAKQEFSYEYLGGWFDGEWKDSQFVTEMATMPSKDELVGKFMFMMNYPVQSFVRVLDQIASQKSE